jgi:hypothetical protein
MLLFKGLETQSARNNRYEGNCLEDLWGTDVTEGICIDGAVNHALHDRLRASAAAGQRHHSEGLSYSSS